MDIADRAARLEAHNRRIALAKQRSRSREPKQDIVDGVVYCIDCGIEVQPERLKIKPNAARCIDCQKKHELKERQKHGH